MGAAPSGFVREPRMGAGRGGEHGSGLPANECGERASGRISYAGGSQLPLLGTGLHVSAIDAAVQVAVPVRLIALGVVGGVGVASLIALDHQVRVKLIQGFHRGDCLEGHQMPPFLGVVTRCTFDKPDRLGAMGCEYGVAFSSF